MPATGTTVIESLGVYLPPKAVSTEEVLRGCRTEITFPLESLTGIRSRRVAGETEFSIDLAANAVAACLERSRYEPADIDLLICCNISRCDRPNTFTFEPNTSIRLKERFGFDAAMAFDIANACAGMFTAISIADTFLKLGLIRCAMVASGEYITHLTRTAQHEIESALDERLACLTLGDAGAALILEQSHDGRAGFHDLELCTLGRYSSYCVAKATDKAHGGAIMFTDSIRLAAAATKHATRHAAWLLHRAGWSPQAFQHLIMHQTSRTSLNGAVREFNNLLDGDAYRGNVVINLAERGNTATTSHFVAVMDEIRAKRIKPGDRVIFSITASGLTVGTALYTFDDLPDRLLAGTAGRSRAGVRIADRDRRAIPHPRNSPRVQIESVGTLPAGDEIERNVVALARHAAEACLARSSHCPQAITTLLYAGVYRNEFISEPALATLVAGALQIDTEVASQERNSIIAYDIFNGGLSFLNACYVAIQTIKAGQGTTAMVIAAEIENNADLFPERLRGIRESGAAAILAASTGGEAGFGNFVFKDFTEYCNEFATYASYEDGKPCLYTEKAATPEDAYLACIPRAVDELLALEGLDLAQISIVFPPQISSAFIARLSYKMTIPKKLFVDVAHDGPDFFTLSMAYALAHAQEHNLVKPGDIGLIINAGSGIQVGCAIYYF
ncbi:MAG TPA: 3-oxoacyl-ACP synthase [Chloroflexi bacterium]|nr:3-oxoacyl-ACP synthase [Chloroflexota bacterium]